MNIQLLQRAVSFSLAASKDGKQIYETAIPYDEKEVTCGLVDLQVELLDIRCQLNANQRSRLNNYDRAIHQLQEAINEVGATEDENKETVIFDSNHILMVINGKPFVFYFNPHMAEDLQKLIHGQIVAEYE
jgi:hypothetical protein